MMSNMGSAGKPSAHFRKRRLGRFMELVDSAIARKGRASVLDVGGTVQYWEAFRPLWQDRPIRFTVLNVGDQQVDDSLFDCRKGDARSMPEFADDSFDVIHSNSVIEHVGHWRDMMAMANEIRRVAPAYFVQTPNIWFPIEPHFKLPVIHWLPEQTRIALLLARKGHYMPRGTRMDRAMEFIQSYNLISGAQMRALFPDAVIERERVLGLTKSLIAVRRVESG